MILETLEFLEGAEPGIGVVESDHEADSDLIVLQVIKERAAIGIAGERPADGMDDPAGLVLGRVDFPQLLDADGESLRIDALTQLEPLEQCLGERAATALGEQCQAPMKLYAGGEIVGGLAVPAHAHIARGGALHPAVLVVKHFGGGKSGIDLDPQPFRLPGEPAAEVAQAGDVIAVVVHLRRRGQTDGVLGGQKDKIIVGRRGEQRGASLLPIRNQLIERARLDDRAGKNMGADFRALLDDADGSLAALLGRQLLQTDRSRQTRRAAADHYHVITHRLPFHRLGPLQIAHVLCPAYDLSQSPRGSQGRNPIGPWPGAAPVVMRRGTTAERGARGKRQFP